MTDQFANTARLPRKCRLTTGSEFKRLWLNGRRRHGESVYLVFFPKGTGPRKLGVVVSKRTGNAVVRSRWKRKIREVFRLNRASLPPHQDVAVVVRKHVRGFPGSELQAQLQELFCGVGRMP